MKFYYVLMLIVGAIFQYRAWWRSSKIDSAMNDGNFALVILWIYFIAKEMTL